MDKVTAPKSANAKLSLKKENLQHLKVRTDLKGGLAARFLPPCGTCHCAAAFDLAAVINPVAR
jgi:hypothetical protein